MYSPGSVPIRLESWGRENYSFLMVSPFLLSRVPVGGLHIHVHTGNTNWTWWASKKQEKRYKFGCGHNEEIEGGT